MGGGGKSIGSLIIIRGSRWGISGLALIALLPEKGPPDTQ